MENSKKDIVLESFIGSVCSATVSFGLPVLFSKIKAPTLSMSIAFGLLAIVIGEGIYIYKVSKKEKKKDEKITEIAEASQKMEELIKKYEEVGITDCTKELKGTEFEPIRCMKSVKHTLYFMGVGGSKWVTGNHGEYEQFENMLKRVKASKRGDIRFLVIDPRGNGYKELEELRGKDAVPLESYRALYSLAKKYHCLQIHLYDHLPSFRLQIVNDEYVTASRYFFEREKFYDSSRGWKIPHLIVKAENDLNYKWSLYDSFRQLYDYIWENSKSITELENTDILK